MKLRLLIIALAICTIATPAMADMTFNYESVAGDLNSLTSPYGFFLNFEVDNFSTSRPAAWTYIGNSQIYTGDGYIGGTKVAAAPYNSVTLSDDLGAYLSVPLDITEATSPQSVAVDFGGSSYDYLGLMWGSMDSYNRIDFYEGTELVGFITGSDVTRNGASGGQEEWENNAYVNIFTGFTFDNIVIESESYAFELDNLAVAVVPVPAAVLLGMLGLGVAGIKLRKYA